MQFTSVRLLVDNFAECFRFYRDVLGFTPYYGDEDDLYGSFETGGVLVALFDRKAMFADIQRDLPVDNPPIQTAGLLAFAVECVDEAVAVFKARGVTLLREPHDRPDWGIRVAHFCDPAGNLIEINQGIPMTE